MLDVLSNIILYGPKWFFSSTFINIFAHINPNGPKIKGLNQSYNLSFHIATLKL